MANLLRVVIDRATWDIPENRKAIGVEDGSLLLNPETGFRCCLGFLGKACGIADRLLSGAPEPQSVESDLWPAGLLDGVDGYENDAFANETDPAQDVLMETNDSEFTALSIREERIAETGIKAGIKFTFKGKYLKAATNV
jgi:hypothetical protein